MTKEIEERAKELLDTILERYYSRETWDNRSLAEMIDEEMLKYTRDIQDVIEPAIYTILADSFTKTIPTVVPTPVQLSNMLYKNAKRVSAETYAVIKQSIKGQETATALAMKLYDGYNFKDEAVLDVYERLPKYIKNYIAKPTNKKEIIRNINKLKTKPLKVATQQIVKAVEDMNEKALEKALKVVTEEKSRYYANRIAQTETQRAKSLADAKDMMDDEEIEFIKHEMSSLHKIHDICDAFNDADPYGYGKGIYPKEKFPALPHHPHCKCSGNSYYRSPKKKKSGYGMRKFIEDQPAYKQRDILGSWDNVKKFKNGTSPVTIWNSQRSEKYKTQTVSEVLSITRPFKQ